MLQIKDLVFNPQGDRNILDGINLEIPQGKLIVLTGPNGGGKTTLAKTIAGINTPTSGDIIFKGQSIKDLDPTEHAKLGIGFAFQQPVRFKGIMIRDLLNIAAGKELTDEEVKDVLEKVGMDYASYANRAVDNYLSGGEIKRIEIATVILRNTELSIFDEPEAGIDLWSFNSL
ncbi:MAG: ATP-binding cassette domain-containing protein, partial [Clostridia bacterium]|nr:ATP-binding cassette domain-containing protein [Clostridia bacterium]